MRTPFLSRRLAAAVIAVGALAGLTACTGSPVATGSSTPSTSASADAEPGAGSGDGQTTEEACQLVNDTITAATEEFENLSADDPDAVVEAFQEAAQSIADASSQVSNEEVAAFLPSLQELFTDVADLLPAIVEGDTSRAAEFQQVGADLQSTMREFEELCAPAE